MSNSKKPIILKRMVIKPGPAKVQNKVDLNVNQKLIKLATIPLYREDVIFESNGEAFIPGEYQSVMIMNKLNNLTSNCQTIAHCVNKDHEIIVLNSDSVTRVIGHEAYNTIFYALCSVINQEYRIKGILSLLTARGTPVANLEKLSTHKACQTDETRMVKKKWTSKRAKKVPAPYAVKPDYVIKRLTVLPPNWVPTEHKSTVNTEDISNSDFVPFLGKVESLAVNEASVSEKVESIANEASIEKLPELGSFDDCNESLKSFSTFSCQTTTELMLNPMSIVDNVVRHTQESVVMNHKMVLTDGTEVVLRFKPEDMFHIATTENLQDLDEVNKKKLLLHQMHIDFKYCLSLRDEDGNLPLHVAVINDDIAMLKRQCVVLNIRKQSVDIPTTNGLTALKLSLFRASAEATSVLLRHGADPFLDVGEHSSCAHLAAELRTEHLAHILNHCKLHARSIITHNAEELQTPGWQAKTDDELSSILLHSICTTFDKQGYTPLMLASKLGLYENTRLLVECSPSSVHLAMPTSGNTALYLAVSASCSLAAERGNKSKVVDHFRKTVEILLDAGADPTIDNNYGSNVNLLLQEFQCYELSMLVANRVTHNRFTDEDFTRNCDEFVIMKEGDKVSLQDIKKPKNTKNIGKDITKDKDFAKIIDKDIPKSIDNPKKDKDIAKNIDKVTPKNIDKGNPKTVDEDIAVTIKKEVDNDTEKELDITELGKNLNELVAKGFVKLFATDIEIKTETPVNQKDAKDPKKPIITENILLKKPNDANLNDSNGKKSVCKLDTVQTISKKCYYNLKRKSDANDTKNPKMKKA